MMLPIREVLTGDALTRCRQLVSGARWGDGRMTAGTQSEQSKNNLQLPEDSVEGREAAALILDALAKNPLFFTAALPKRIFPPLFNCYTGTMNAFGNHVDSAIRTDRMSGNRIRTDLSATLFLSDPEEYDGGELVVEDHGGLQSVKLAAGDLILYPATTVHRVEPVTRGARVASFFWIESMVRENDRRHQLFDLDMAIMELRNAVGDTPAVVKLTGCYHNLLRMWADA